MDTGDERLAHIEMISIIVERLLEGAPVGDLEDAAKNPVICVGRESKIIQNQRLPITEPIKKRRHLKKYDYSSVVPLLYSSSSSSYLRVGILGVSSSEASVWYRNVEIRLSSSFMRI